MKDILFNYWKELIVLVFFVLEFLLLFRKNKKDGNLYSDIFTVLPSIISKAEKSIGSGHGSEKLKVVLEVINNLFVKETGKAMTRSDEKFFESAIEKILSTPKKKEALDEVKK